jgi:ADP-ribose pyrophosphatase
VLSAPEDRGGGFQRYERYSIALDGATFVRDTLRVGKVVVILPVDLDRDEVVLIRQFRVGAHLAIGLGDLVEVPAGRVERGEDVAVAAHRECEEEIGVAPRALVPLFELMPSAGATDEHMFFFLTLVDAAKVPERAGAAHEQKDTRPLSVPIDDALGALQSGTLHYGAAVIALQWLALNRARLPDIARRGRAR